MALSTEQAPAGQLKRPHLHLVWKPAGQPNASWKWRLFGYYWRETPRRLNLVFSLRGILLWTASLAFAAYLIGAAVLVTLWSRSPYNQVGYLDVVLPTRWSDLRALRGKGMIEEGIAEIKAKRYATGMLLLMRGVAMCPQSANGRLQLAGIFASIGQLHRAKQLMMDGFEHGPTSRAYEDFAFRLTFYLEDYDAMLGIAQVIQKRPPDQVARDTLKWHALALEKLHRFEELNTLREQTKQRGFNTAVEQAWARAQLTRGNPAVGLGEILRTPEHFGLPGERLQLQLDLAVAARDSERALASVEEWRKMDPYGPLPRVREIIATIRLGHEEAADEKIKAFFLHYASDLPAVVLLFRSLVELEEARWLKAAYAEARAAGKIPISATILFVQGLLVCGEVDVANREFVTAEAFIKKNKVDDGQWSIGTGRLINALMSPSSTNDTLLLDFFTTKQATPESFRFAWKALARVQSPLAGDISQLAQNRYPAIRLGDPEIMAKWARRSEQKEFTKEPPSGVQETKSLTTRAPAVRAAPSESQKRSELQRIDDLLAQRAYEESADAIRQLERLNDEAYRIPISLRRIELHGERSELGELTAALRVYLRGQSPSFPKLRALAEKWRGPQQRESALVLLREVRSRYPEALWTEALQKELERGLLIAPAPNITDNRN